jgi:hypothetical protein
MKARQVKDLIWDDLESFLRNPSSIILQLKEMLDHALADTEGLHQSILKVKRGIAGKETERENKYTAWHAEAK